MKPSLYPGKRGKSGLPIHGSSFTGEKYTRAGMLFYVVDDRMNILFSKEPPSNLV
jgi:hypothetical protein